MSRPASTVPTGRPSTGGFTRGSVTAPPWRALVGWTSRGRGQPSGSRAVSRALLEPPAMGEPRHARVANPRAHGEGVEAAVVVVRVSVARVGGHVEEIFTLDQVEVFDLHGHHPLAVDLAEAESLQRGIGPVAADPVLPEHADA